MACLLLWWRRPQHGSKEAIERLRDVERLYEARLQYLGKKQRDAKAEALARRSRGATHEALLKLSEAKRYDKTMTTLVRQAQTVAELREAIEHTVLMREMVQGMRQGADALRSLNRQIDVNKLDQLVDDTADQVALSHELMDRLSESADAVAPPLTAAEEHDLEAELEAMQGKQRASSFVSVPHEEPQQQEDDMEMRRLVASMT